LSVGSQSAINSAKLAMLKLGISASVKRYTLVSAQINKMGECELFGWFGYLIQGVLATICFLSMIYKRYKEHPRRPWKIFLLDVSK
jgi:hypothetical protein